MSNSKLSEKAANWSGNWFGVRYEDIKLHRFLPVFLVSQNWYIHLSIACRAAWNNWNKIK